VERSLFCVTVVVVMDGFDASDGVGDDNVVIVGVGM
jgi:hypothetical protein